MECGKFLLHLLLIFTNFYQFLPQLLRFLARFNTINHKNILPFTDLPPFGVTFKMFTVVMRKCTMLRLGVPVVYALLSVESVIVVMQSVILPHVVAPIVCETTNLNNWLKQEIRLPSVN